MQIQAKDFKEGEGLYIEFQKHTVRVKREEDIFIKVSQDGEELPKEEKNFAAGYRIDTTRLNGDGIDEWPTLRFFWSVHCDLSLEIDEIVAGDRKHSQQGVVGTSYRLSREGFDPNGPMIYITHGPC